MQALTVQQAIQLAQQHHQAGRLAEAEALYRQILTVQPNHADALHRLGLIACQIGRQDLGVHWFRQAIVANPHNPAAHSNLGAALTGQGQLEEAIAACRRAIDLAPDFAEAHTNLGNALRNHGHLEEAAAAYRQALEFRPADPVLHNNLGIALAEQGHLEEAIAVYRRALQIRPELPEIHNNLGNALKDRGRWEEALAAYGRALELKPGYPRAHYNLGNALRVLGQLDEAVAAYTRALQLQPEYPEAQNNLGAALAERGQLDEAVAAYQRALELKADYPDACNNLGNALRDQGQLNEALTAYRRAFELHPTDARVLSNLIYTLHFHPDYDDGAIAEEHHRWNRQFSTPLKHLRAAHGNNRRPDRQLRIGYVSPDFRAQAEAHFLVPLLEAHDRGQFEIHCYASLGRPDAVSDRLRRNADFWHAVQGLSDHDLAQKIRADEIDILVDLTMHMAHNRLPVFARKPAPVQVAWLAYPGSTGLDTMDYRITDSYLDPPGLETPSYSENSVRLPNCWCCYHPLTDEPALNSLPAGMGTGITFGCLNNFCKINDRTLELYASVLRAVEGSRLILLAPEGSQRQRILELLGPRGVLPQRIEFVGRVPRADYLKLYHRIDLALDTLPYNGITTTCDAFWMGVPVVSLRGKTAAGRAGFGLLSMLDLSELATTSPQEFVRVAEGLVRDPSRLSELRRTLRPRMESSPLMDAARFARDLEAAFRRMWEQWCTA